MQLHDKEQKNFMNISTDCAFCIINKQKKVISAHKDSPECEDYLQDVMTLMGKEAFSRTSVWLTREIEQIQNKYFHDRIDYRSLKHKYNQYLLSREDEIRCAIEHSEDRILSCIRYVCAANYIDFGAVEHVSDDMLNDLLEREVSIDTDELRRFKSDLAQAKSLVYITDNCGEVVLDKLFIETMRQYYPELHITVLLRGGEAGNDATMEDAEEIGLIEVAECMGNGSNLCGTDFSELSKDAAALLSGSDLIIAKGQANFETMHGGPYNPYYLFLCKCEHFTTLFQLPQYSPVLIREDELQQW